MKLNKPLTKTILEQHQHNHYYSQSWKGPNLIWILVIVYYE